MKAIRVQFKETGKRYFFSPGKLDLHENDLVVVSTIRGVEIGKVNGPLIELDSSKFDSEIKEILRVASDKDIDNYNKNKEDGPEIVHTCKQYALRLGLDMKVLSAEYTLDRQKLTIMFESDGRIDFRELVRLLAENYHTRIELRQVGSRDGAKEIGGIGPCGLVVCCKTFLTEFSNVSIKMAKNQSLSLNPAKISGNCGKLLCCINYENDFYTELRKNAPDIGDIIEIKKGQAKVLSVDVLNRTCKVKYLEEDSFDYPSFDDLTIVRRKRKPENDD
ncbi:MAG: stage 0 sporulation protein [Acholeplasmatales bacterium]|nr:stage 0 sporulation protein [Acholeplasmatales bacterium]